MRVGGSSDEFVLSTGHPGLVVLLQLANVFRFWSFSIQCCFGPNTDEHCFGYSFERRPLRG